MTRTEERPQHAVILINQGCLVDRRPGRSSTSSCQGDCRNWRALTSSRDAPAEMRGEFRPIATKTPGIEICEYLPQLAKRSHLWALLRSLTHGSNDHSAGHHIMLTGRSDLPPGFNPNAPLPGDWPSIAAVAGALTGTTSQSTAGRRSARDA